MCGLLAAIKSVTYLLSGEIRFNVIHGSKNGRTTVEHSWETYSPDMFLVKTLPKKRNPEYITCPMCGKEGRVNEFHPKIHTRPDKTRFYVKHEYIGGTWGKTKYKRFRRCYFNKTDLIYRRLADGHAS